jgi:cell division protein FtsB
MSDESCGFDASTGCPPPPRGGGFRRFLVTGCARATRLAIVLAGLLLVALLIRSSHQAHVRNVALWTRAESISAECRRLEERRASLARETSALEHDPFYIEKRVRQDLRQLRPGEFVLDRALRP